MDADFISSSSGSNSGRFSSDNDEIFDGAL